MGKPFYSLDEVCEMLGKKPEEIRKLVREGELREFRDAGKIFFKAEDVHALGGTPPPEEEEVQLEAAEEETAAAPMPEVSPPPTPGGTSIIGLAPIEDEQAEEKKEGTVISASGIGVFDEDELEIDADPMAETQVTQAESIDDQVALEGSGSGSGLLDLTRESDDTSLGAELLDEIYPGEEEAVATAEEPEAEAEAEEEEEAEPEAAAETFEPVESGQALAAPRVVVSDPYEGLFAGFLVAALVLLGVAGTVVGGVLQGYLPDYARLLTDNFYIFLASAGGLLVICVVVGMFIGRAFMPKRR